MGEDGNIGFSRLMPGVVSGTATALTALAGLLGVLHETGLLWNRAPAASTAVAAKASAQAQLPVPGAVRRFDVSGAWKDSGPGACHAIKQIGDELLITNYKPSSAKPWTIGRGTIRGRIIHFRFNELNPGSPEAEFLLSNDGRELSGTIRQHQQDQEDREFPALWHYAGPHCG